MAALSQGAEFAGYRIDGVVGQGGMGVVYRATQVRLARPVALKVITPDLADEQSFRERFERESQLAASIDHPNVLPVYEAGEADGRLFIAMRFVDGTDLGELIEREGGLDPDRAAHLVGQVAGALEAAHRRGLVHRDVKPANVLVTGEDEEHAYLADFGLSKSSQMSKGLTKTGNFVGTLDYVAPELIQGHPADANTDTYALGCVLYHAVTGDKPYVSESEAGVMYAHLHEEPPAASDKVAAAAPLDGVIEKAMAKDPVDRYGSSAEFGRAARAAVGDPTPPAGRPSTVGAAAAKPPSKPPVAKGSDGEDEDDRRGLRIALGIALPAVLVIGLIAAGLAAVGVFGGDDSSSDGGTGTPASQPAPPPAGGGGSGGGGGPVARVLATIKVGDGPDGVAVDSNTVYVANSNDDTISRIDAKGERVLGKPIPVDDNPDSIVVGKGTVWVTSTGANDVDRFDATVDPPVAGGKIGVGQGPEGISLGRQLVWVANSGDGTVNRIDRASPTLLGGPIAVGNEPTDLFVGKASVWVTNTGDGTVNRIDPSTAQLEGAPIKVGKEPRGVVEALGSVWIANSGDNTVTRLDARTGKPIGRAINVGRNPRQLAAGFRSLWVTNAADNTVTRLDLKTGKVIGQPISVGGSPIGVAVGPRAIWVANNRDDTIAKIDPGDVGQTPGAS